MADHPSVGRFARRLTARGVRAAYRLLGQDWITRLKIVGRPDLETVGRSPFGWTIPTSGLDENSICYCVGVGEDISFDLALLERFNCVVYAFDPTPRAIRHVAERGEHNGRYQFVAVGLWDSDTLMKFYAPANPQHVSHSILNLQKTAEYFEAPCRRLSSIMREYGHGRLELLKLDIEGAECQVIRSMLDDGLPVRIVCVEFDEIHSPLDDHFQRRIYESSHLLADAGYELVAVDGSNYTFVRSS